MKAIDFIQKHKFFFVILLALFTLLLGVFYVTEREGESAEQWIYGEVYTKHYTRVHAYWSDSTEVSTEYFDKDTCHITGKRSSEYVSSDGNTYKSSVGQIIVSWTNENTEETIYNVADTYNTSSTTGSELVVNTTNKVAADVINNIMTVGSVEYTFYITVIPIDGFEATSLIKNEGSSFNSEVKYITKTVYKFGYSSIMGFYSIYDEEKKLTTEEFDYNDKGSTITASQNFYVVFRPKTYSITYDANGGTFSGGATSKTVSTVFYENYNIPSETPTRENYTFLGWSINGINPIQTNQPFTNTGETTLKALWTGNPFYIDCDAGYGKFSDGSQFTTVERYYGGSYTDIPTATRTGYNLTGWYYNDLVNGWTELIDVYLNAEGNEVQSCSEKVDGTIDYLSAYWEAKKYTITFEKEGGSDGIASIIATYDSVYPAIISTSGWKPSRTGYTFKGFYTQSSGGTMIYNSEGAVVSGRKYTTADNTTLYAQWTENTYNIAFNANGGSGSMSTMTGIKYKASTPLTANSFTKTGYLFAGWATSASGAVVYSDGQSVSKLTAKNGETINLYAKWTPITYTVKYNANGGSGSMSNTTVTYDKSFTLRQFAFTSPTKYFIGWATSASGGVAYKDRETITTNLASTQGATINLYAVWLDTWANHGTAPSGSGTASNPYIIQHARHLGWIASQVNNSSTNASMRGKYFKQVANINLRGYTWKPIGDQNCQFILGHYDGGGYIITNLKTSSAVDASDNSLYNYLGLFGYVSKASIENVSVSGTVYGRVSAGLLVGGASLTTIANCITYGNVFGFNYIGGLVGESVENKITGCYSSAFVKAQYVGFGCGGMMGNDNNSIISACGFEGTVGNCPLFLGTGNNTTITDCFANSNSTVSAFYLTLSGSSSISSCLFIANNKSASPTKKFYGGTFESWVIPPWVENTTTNRTPLPAGLSWLAISGDKVTGLSQITALGYVSA